MGSVAADRVIVDVEGRQLTLSNLGKVLYPEDSTPQGKELRLQQQYFFVSASIQDFLGGVLALTRDEVRSPSQPEPALRPAPESVPVLESALC